MADRLILIVDRNKQNRELLEQFLRKEGYKVCLAANVEDLDQLIADQHDIKLTLVDITGFDRDIWERCEHLRDMGIPFLVISPRQMAAVHQEGYSHGAQGILVKPLAQKELLAIINSLLEEADE
jgi:DNA-binding response OmpR family regulator